MDMKDAMEVAASGMRAQSERLRVVSENLANANATADHPDDLPYRRQVVTFENALDEASGLNKVKIDEVERDKSDFSREYQPGHPAANDQGYVLKPNVDTVIELNDMRQSHRSYNANLNVIQTSKKMMTQTLSLLR